MREQREFATVFRGFEKKAVLEYIYEQDREARAALDDLADRNVTLEGEAADLRAKMAALSVRNDTLESQNRANRNYLSSVTDECATLKMRLAKLNDACREQDASLQKQTELGLKLRRRLEDEEKRILQLQKELEESRRRCRETSVSRRDFDGLRDRVDALKNQFAEKIALLERDLTDIETRGAPPPREAGKKAGTARNRPDRGTVLRNRWTPGGCRVRIQSILDEWK